MSTDYKLLDAYDKITSTKITERNSGLSDLKQLLSNSQNAKTLNDKGYHKMYEALFRAVMADKKLYMKQDPNANMGKSVASRLSTSGSVLRLAVEMGVTHLKPKTIKAVYSHIIDVLPMGNLGLCKPISLDYIKALRACLEYPTHTEHLQTADWDLLVKFCCLHLGTLLGLLETDEDDEDGQSHQDGRALLREDSMISMISKRSTGNSQSASRLGHDSEELFGCLRCLVSAPNAPILNNAEMICDILLKFLDSQPSATRAHQPVFSSLNFVLVSIVVNNIELTNRISDMIPQIIIRLWDTKSPGLKEEMMISLIYCQPYIRNKIHESREKSLPLRRNIEDLLETLCNEYITRPDRELLQMDDIVFPPPLRPPNVLTDSLSLRSMALRKSLGDFRNEQTWATPGLIASMVEMLDKPGDAINQSQAPVGHNEIVVKRQRLYTNFDEMMRYVRSSNTPRKLLALQVLPFLCDIGGVNEEEYANTIQTLYDACSDDNPSVLSWALLSIGSCAFLKPARSPCHYELWHQVWKLCTRYAVNHSTCRAACHVMSIILSHDLIPYSNIAKQVDTTIGSIDLNGPASIADSPLALWKLVLEKRNTVAQSSRLHAGERLFMWFMAKWHPVDDLERNGGTFYAQIKSHHVSATDVINFLSACAGIDCMIFEPAKHNVYGSIGRACLRNSQYHGLRSVLLDLYDKDDTAKTEGTLEHSNIAGLANQNASLELQIIDLLARQTQFVNEKWETITSAQIQHVTESILRNFVGFILICSTMCSRVISEEAMTKSAQLARILETKLLDNLVSYLASETCKEKQIDGLLLALSDFLPRPSQMVNSTSLFRKTFQGTTGSIFSQIYEVLNQKESAGSSLPASAGDPMDIDDGFGASASFQYEKKRGKGLQHREELQALCSDDGFRSSTKSLIALSACVLKHVETVDICGDFIDYLTSIPKAQLVMARPVVKDFFFCASDKIFDDDLGVICEYMAVELLEGYDIERCETNLLLCFDMVNALANRWVAEGEANDIILCCKAIYDHAVKIGLDKRVTSHTIRISIAGLLHHVISVDPQYKPSKKTPIALYFELLADKDVRVTYSVSQKLPSLFLNYEVDTHSALFGEVEKFLPQNREWTEGLAMRVHTLAKLASAGSSSISRIVFRIFETGLTDGARYAGSALLSVAKASGLRSQRELFNLFSSKLIYTWTEFYDLSDFPFRAFGYNSLKEMCSDVADELTAQLLAKDKDRDVEFVASVLEISTNELLVQSFPKIIAYGFAWAIGHSPKGEEKRHSVVVRVRKRLGDPRYVELAANNFRLIISYLFQLMQEEGVSEKLLSRDPALAEACLVMKDITEQGYAEQKLADPVRPYFRVKIILTAIWNLCEQAQVGSKIWSAEMVAYIIRDMLDTLHPARGSIHACSVIRNIRLLICLAGPVVHEGYLLEMIIHGLKPYVIDIYCSEDTIGILRYLLIKGQLYLSKKPTFVLGFFLSLLASLHNHLRVTSTKAQTNVSVVREFHTWVADQLLMFKFSGLDDMQRTAFQSIVKSAVGFQGRGNALKNTKESELLTHLLDDDIRKKKLLDNTSRRLAFTLFTSDFQRPEFFRDDIFGNDAESFKRSKSLLRICKRFDVNDGFLLWSARVLGRSYAATGQLHNDWMREIEFSHPTEFSPDSMGIDYAPKAGILTWLREMLFSEDSSVVSLIERTIERIIYEESQPTREDDATWSYVLDETDFRSLFWPSLPDFNLRKSVKIPILDTEKPDSLPVDIWIRRLTNAICSNLPEDPVAHTLIPILEKLDGISGDIFHYVTHVLLLRNMTKPKSLGYREELSQIFRECLSTCTEATVPHNTILIKCILYLRTQTTPKELPDAKTPKKTSVMGTKSLRDLWLDIDYLQASRAACTCRMFKTALLFSEIHYSTTKADCVPSELLLEIFKNVDDPDSYYGVSQVSSLETVLNRFEYEGDGWKSLSLRGANLESRIRLGVDIEGEDLGVVDALNNLGLNGLSRSLLDDGSGRSVSADSTDKMFQSAWKLEQWDLPCPGSFKTRSATIYRALKSINSTADLRAASLHADPPFLEVMKDITAGTQTGHTLGGGMRTLAMLTEMEEIIGSSDSQQMEDAWEKINKRTKWMHTGRYSDVGEIMSMRQATFGSLAKQDHLQASSRITPKLARLLEAKTLVECCKMARSHKILQHALTAATQLSKVVEPCKNSGLDIHAMATLQAAHVLWDDGQGIASIRMLQYLENESDNSQTLVVGKPKLLAKLGNWISEARLEKPDKIMSDYLENAIRRLEGQNKGSDAGRVFHEFASFCDQQLQNPGNIEDYERALKLRQAKEEEVREADRLSKAKPKQVDVQQYLRKAKTWLALDDEEFNRLKHIRETFLEKSILNHLRCLSACDDYDSEAVRFCALWLANLNNPRVNSAASIISNVPSRKFVPLVNQLSSRLQDTQDDFQRLLLEIIIRMCKDHPFHSIYQILALTKIRSNEETSLLRRKAALKVTAAIGTHVKSQKVFSSINESAQTYTKLAHSKVNKPKDGAPVPLRTFLSRERMAKLEQIPSFRIPPPTMHIDIRADCDYSRLPWLQKFDPDATIASGISAPKIIKCQASNGQIFKSLVKGGNDDLRQDAIMEQVFEQVSFLLQKNRITRQRNLKVRTYKVIPLTTTSGIIEFVPNTVPLHDYILPAHGLYHPQDWHHSKCRKVISDAQNKSRDVRVAEFQRATSHFRPVMHYFFMHRFNGPDDWYASRLAYTRSTAAISILGHVLGLGDRHGHNILLDDKTGEVVHIDLGVAFEQGRILPVPEVVPFRLTRDIVDGMGVTKTDGVFRRCCEFTLEVLRNESYNIITILDVLRYDPLYNWAISPVRLNRIQNQRSDEQVGDDETTVNRLTKPKEEPGEAEADRALAVVAKKLSKTLSVGATVNELIQQSGDERNLAVLYSGWAAYA
ncbi:hypothetical protein EDC01DRAFT_638230 [Geopyxis carbonaria]|nr:hypothetical protein EDC01DRAFT_638230 [Geopyxis carbonaria]